MRVIKAAAGGWGNPGGPMFAPAIPTGDVIAVMRDGAWNGGAGLNLTYSVPTGTSTWPTYGPGQEPSQPGYGVLSVAQANAFRAAMELWDSYVAASFNEVADNAGGHGQIRAAFTTMGGGTLAYAGLPLAGSNPNTLDATGDIWISSTQTGANFAQGQGGFATLLHEIGHALGLDHTHNDDGNPSDALPAQYDNVRYSVMSYNGVSDHKIWDWVPGEVPGLPMAGGGGHSVVAITPMLFDILVIQDMYGASTTTNLGATTYTFDPNVATLRTIFDSEGIDTFDLSGHVRPSIIDLNPASFSSVDYYSLSALIEDTVAMYSETWRAFITDHYTFNAANTFTWSNNVAIAYGVTIENVIAGNGDDEITGNSANNALSGNAGDDTLIGADGADTLTGGAGFDTLSGGAGADVFAWTFGDGNGIIDGGADSDTFNISGNASTNILKVNYNGSLLIAAAGHTLASVETVNANMGGGGDLLEYVAASSAATVNLATGTASGFASIANIAHVTGGGGGDNLIGDANANRLEGGGGTDTLTGGGGIDQLRGGDNADVLSGGLGNDNIYGEAGDDVIGWSWGEGNDTVDGGDGFDAITFNGTAGSNLFKVGYDGTKLTAAVSNPLANVEAVMLNANGGGDWLMYKLAATGVTVNLATLAATGFASIFGLSHVEGGAGGDTLTGDGNFNKLWGADGADTISAGAGNDILRGDAGNDTLTGGLGTDTISGGAGNDSILWNWGDGAGAIDGGADTDSVTFAGDTAANLLKVLWNGTVLTDVLSNTLSSIETVNADMGGGANWLIYTATAGVSVNLLTNTASGFASIANIVNVQGGDGADTLTGNESDNKIVGGAGADTITGGAGADTLTGGLGNDEFVYAAGAGNDVITDFDAAAAGGQDFIDLTGFGITAGTFGGRVSIVDAGPQTIVTIDGTVVITLWGVDGAGDNVITVDDFLLS